MEGLLAFPLFSSFPFYQHTNIEKLTSVAVWGICSVSISEKFCKADNLTDYSSYVEIHREVTGYMPVKDWMILKKNFFLNSNPLLTSDIFLCFGANNKYLTWSSPVLSGSPVSCSNRTLLANKMTGNEIEMTGCYVRTELCQERQATNMMPWALPTLLSFQLYKDQIPVPVCNLKEEYKTKQREEEKTL